MAVGTKVMDNILLNKNFKHESSNTIVKVKDGASGLIFLEHAC